MNVIEVNALMMMKALTSKDLNVRQTKGKLRNKTDQSIGNDNDSRESEHKEIAFELYKIFMTNS